MNKLKVVWLCHFVTDRFNARYHTHKRERAPWMDLFFDLIRKIPAVEVHVIAPNLYTNTNDEFIDNGITFHLYQYYYAVLPGKCANLSLALTSGRCYWGRVKALVEAIDPDLIHLFGSENPDYSPAILSVYRQYKVLVSIQGEISNARLTGNLWGRIYRMSQIRNEKKINSRLKYFTLIDDENWKKEFKDKYPGAQLFNMYFPTKLPDGLNGDTEKKYDFVFYGRISYFKGIEDLILALAVVKKKKKDVSLLVVGRIDASYNIRLEQLIKKNDLEGNVIFAGFQKTQEDVFTLALQAQIYVLPTHFDGLPGTIRECMYLKIPVITYPVGAIPSLNKQRTGLLFAGYKNIQDLADKMSFLLNNEPYRQELIRNAHITITKEYANENIAPTLLNIYSDIIGCGQ